MKSSVPELLRHVKIWKILLSSFCLLVPKDCLTLKGNRDHKTLKNKPHLSLCVTWIKIIYSWTAARLHNRKTCYFPSLTSVLFSHRRHRCDLCSARRSQPVCGFSCPLSSGALAHPLCRAWTDCTSRCQGLRLASVCPRDYKAYRRFSSIQLCLSSQAVIKTVN